VGALQDKLDELTEAVEAARAMPLSSSCVLNRPEVLATLEELRALLPTEIASAQELVDDRASVVESGRREAARILAEAKAERARLVSRPSSLPRRSRPTRCATRSRTTSTASSRPSRSC